MNHEVTPESLHELEHFIHHHFDRILKHGGEEENKGHFQLIESIKYSLFSGGKRFRPSVGLLLGAALNVPTPRIVPWLAAVECIHTYSLIHDDLPAMDNDSLRRGKPTNHILFGESTALLAGDALLTEAFHIIADSYSDSPDLGLKLVKILSQAAGAEGMVAGQAMDLALVEGPISADTAELIHHLKTGALIRSVSEGLGVLARCSSEDQTRLLQFGAHLGFAFQLKDDLLDFEADKPDPKNLVTHIGLGKTKDRLTLISRKAEQELLFLGRAAEPLLRLIEYNVRRTH